MNEPPKTAAPDDAATDDTFQLYDLRVEVVESERPFVMHVKKGDYFDVIGGRVVLPADNPSFSLYGLLAVLPFIPAKQRPTHPNDWMTSDCLIASTDPACGARFRITRLDQRALHHGDFSVVPLGQKN
ncbi:MAG: TIGR04076 family protein [Lautropia sp.]